MSNLFRLAAAGIALCLAYVLTVRGLAAIQKADAPPPGFIVNEGFDTGEGESKPDGSDTVSSITGESALGSITPSDTERYDFVQSLQEHNETAGPLYARVTGDRRIEVLIPFNGGRYAHYSFLKDDKDDFIKLQNGAVSVLEQGSIVKLFDTLQPWSNKEFALNVLPEGAARKAEWIPEHSGVGTAFAESQRISFDSTEITDWTPGKPLQAVGAVKIEQRLKAIFPDDPVHPVADIESLFTADKDGVSIQVKITWLQNATVTAGYGMMFPALSSFAGKLVTSYGNVYDATATDGSVTNLIEDDRASSYAFVPTSGGGNGESGVMVAMNVDDIAKTFRYGEAGRRAAGPIVWLQHRDQTMQKLYPHVYHNHPVKPGDTYEVAGRFFIGEMPPVFTAR